MKDIDSMNISNIDLNLLVVFKELYEQKNVSKVAMNLGLSQPTISHSLKRLRETFDDELFIRSGKHMVATEKANQLGPVLVDKLKEINEALFTIEEFDPLEANSHFRFSGTSYDSSIWFPKLMKLLNKRAPNCSFEFVGINIDRYYERMASGEVDISFAANLSSQKNYAMEPMYDSDFKLIAKKSSYKSKTSISLAEYLEKDHVSYTPTEKPGSHVDDTLRKMKKKRNIKIKTSYLNSIPLLVCEADYLAIVPGFYAEKMKKYFPIKLFDPPMKLESFEHQMLWHKSKENSAEHKWLREVIKEEYESLMFT